MCNNMFAVECAKISSICHVYMFSNVTHNKTTDPLCMALIESSTSSCSFPILFFQKMLFFIFGLLSRSKEF